MLSVQSYIDVANLKNIPANFQLTVLQTYKIEHMFQDCMVHQFPATHGDGRSKIHKRVAKALGTIQGY